MKTWFVVYALGHLISAVGPFEDASVCQRVIVGFDSVKTEYDNIIQRGCELRAKQPEMGEVDSQS